MRLGQLSRKIAISQAEITAFLANSHISTDEGSNTKLQDEHVKLILQYYGKDLPVTLEESEHFVAPEVLAVTNEGLPTTVIIDAATVTAVDYNEMAENQANREIVPPVQPHAAEINANEGNVVSDNLEEKPILIKAIKVELSGLKVVGKIELPQSRKKEDELEKKDDVLDKTTEPLISPERRTYSGERQQDRGKRVRQGQRPGKNPVALEREREAREAEEKRQEHAMLEKERRTQYYQQRVKASVPTKPARIFDEPVTEMKNDRSTSSKSWFGKFFRWFKS